MNIAAQGTPCPFAESGFRAREIELLESLRMLLGTVRESLACGEAQAVPQTSGQIEAAAKQLCALAAQLARCPENAETQLRRRKLLLEIRQQSAFCRALLRRWRRCIAVREQLLEMRTQSPMYAEPFPPAREHR